MKTRTTLLMIFGLAFVILSCKKDNSIFINYPKEGDYGENILQTDSLHIISSIITGVNKTYYYYSLRAELPLNTSIKIIMKNSSNSIGTWSYSVSTSLGWSIDSYDQNNKSQQFIAYGQSICDLKIFFPYSGSAEIDIYENKATIPTRIKTINW
jgi:hypothetical protein